MEKPAPLEPFKRGSIGASQIWKKQVICPGEKALASNNKPPFITLEISGGGRDAVF